VDQRYKGAEQEEEEFFRSPMIFQPVTFVDLVIKTDVTIFYNFLACFLGCLGILSFVYLPAFVKDLDFVVLFLGFGLRCE